MAARRPIRRQERAAIDTGIKQPIFAVDGKTLRRSHDRRSGLGALRSVSVWASEYGISLGQVSTDEKRNEITAIPEQLKLVDIRGAIITIDATGTQESIAQQVVQSKADYVLALKGNQGKLHQAAISYIEEQAGNDFANVTVRRHTSEEQGHGREETRYYAQLPVPKHLPRLKLWVVMLVRGRGDQETIETRYYISSLSLDVKRFARAVRGHIGASRTVTTGAWTSPTVRMNRESATRICERTAPG